MKTNIKPIASISTIPSRVSLASSPNFLELESNSDAPSVSNINRRELKIVIKNTVTSYSDVQFTITSTLLADELIIKSTQDVKLVNSTTFLFVPNNLNVTIQNIKDCFSQNAFLKNSFHIVAYPLLDGNQPHIILVSKNVLEIDDIKIVSNYNTGISIADKTIGSQKQDTITANMLDPKRVRIELEIYDTNTDSDKLGTSMIWGTPIATLEKAYSSQPIWFDVNTLWHGQAVYTNDFLYANTWCDAGTCIPFRYSTRRNDTYMNETIHVSPILYAISGHDNALEQNDLSRYTLNIDKNKLIEPLSTNKQLWHVRKQSQFFNFVMLASEQDDLIELAYTLYDNIGNKLSNEKVKKHATLSRTMAVVNTIQLDIDQVVETHEHSNKIARINVELLQNGQVVSTPMSYDILPENLFDVNDFAYLNSLGGWSTFNFGAKNSLEYKTSTEMLSQTLTPDKRKRLSNSIESVFSKKTDEQFVVETMPLRRPMADSLKEISASPAVYELSSKRYVIVDELVVKTNSSDELFVVEMKYRYSDN